MPYSAEISRANPTCFVFLIDRSGSMDGTLGGGAGLKKSGGLADAINKILYTLVYRCVKGEEILERYYVGVIGYGSLVGPALGGPLAGRGLLSIRELGENPLRVENRTKKESDGAGGLVETSADFPVYFEPVASGGTPMCQALNEARQLLDRFITEHPSAFPPIVLNLTDGEATDGDPEPAATALRALATADGQVLLFNLHLSSRDQGSIEFPDGEPGLPDDHARRLFRMSSPLPPQMREAAQRKGYRVGESSRGFVFNANLVSVIEFLDIGTKVEKNL
jgi:hypothetical protein